MDGESRKLENGGEFMTAASLQGYPKPKGHWRSGTGKFNKPTLIANAWNELTELRLKDGEEPQQIKDEVDLIAELVKILN